MLVKPLTCMVNHGMLFQKLLDRGLPMPVEILIIMVS